MGEGAAFWMRYLFISSEEVHSQPFASRGSFHIFALVRCHFSTLSPNIPDWGNTLYKYGRSCEDFEGFLKAIWVEAFYLLSSLICELASELGRIL